MRTNAKLTFGSVVKDILCGRLTGMSARITRTSAMRITSLGVGTALARPGASASEALRIERREVHGRLAVEEPLGDVAAGGRRMLEAVATEPDCQEEALEPRPSDDRVLVGSEGTQPRPAARDPRLGDHRYAMDGLLHRVLDLAPIHRDVEVFADVLDVAGAHQHLLELFSEVEAAGDICSQRQGPGDRRKRLGEEDVAAPRKHRHLDPREAPDPRRPGPRRVDDAWRGDRPPPGRLAPHPGVGPLHRRDL